MHRKQIYRGQSLKNYYQLKSLYRFTHYYNAVPCKAHRKDAPELLGGLQSGLLQRNKPSVCPLLLTSPCIQEPPDDNGLCVQTRSSGNNLRCLLRFQCPYLNRETRQAVRVSHSCSYNNDGDLIGTAPQGTKRDWKGVICSGTHNTFLANSEF